MKTSLKIKLIGSAWSLLAAVLFITPAVALAQDWDELSADQQQALQAVEENWGELEPQQRERLVRGAERWASMSPADQEQARGRFESNQRVERWQASFQHRSISNNYLF